MQEIEQIYSIKSVNIIIFTVMMAGFTAVRFAYTNIFRNTYQPIALFSFKPMAEQGAGIKLLSTENLLITLLLAGTLSFSLLTFAQYYQLSSINLSFELPSSFPGIIGVWSLLVISIGLLFLVKFAYLGFLGWLFDFPLTQSAHYQEYQSMSHVFNFFFTLILGLGLISMSRMNSAFMDAMAYIYLFFFAYRQIVLIFRLYVKGGYSIYYIFSYLCTTELIPWIICIGIIVNR